MAKLKPLPVVTLLTDFGTRDPYVAEMKGQILRAFPFANIIDITHEIPPHDICTAAIVLGEAAQWFPPGTLHVVVVDPGVGSDRAILAAQFGEQKFLAPDNGVLTILKQQYPLEALAAVRKTDYLQGGAARTFEGRDIFAPAAGNILAGHSIQSLGPVPRTYHLLDFPVPDEGETEIRGEIMYVDRFGNCITNLSHRNVLRRWEDIGVLQVQCGSHTIGRLSSAYQYVEPGHSLALFNSMELLEIAVNQGSACDLLGIGPGTEVRIYEQDFVEA